MALAGCGSDTFFDEPEPQVYTAENDPALEKLETNVGYYYGDKGVDLTRFEFAYRAAGQYCIFPRTEARTQQLEQLAQQEGTQVKKDNGLYIVTASRDFITSDDYVSDMYFVQYYNDAKLELTRANSAIENVKSALDAGKPSNEVDSRIEFAKEKLKAAGEAYNTL